MRSFLGFGYEMDGYEITRATATDRSFIEIAALDKVAWLPEDHSDGEHAWRLCGPRTRFLR
eukprot:SAG11_NODE_4364_length_1931_cov_20.771288_3_plen_61_part_00